MRLVAIESPLRGNVRLNTAYAKLCVLDSIKRGEAPYASHLFYAQRGLLSDLVSAERDRGIEAGLAWGSRADLVAVYVDLGISEGMRRGIQRAKHRHVAVVERRLVERWRDLICPSCVEPRVSSASPCCNPRCLGSSSSGCFHCHHPKYFTGAKDA